MFKINNFKAVLVLTLMLLFQFIMAQENKQVEVPDAMEPTPTEEHLAWHNMEMNVFIHFTTNTFTDTEFPGKLFYLSFQGMHT